MEKFSEKCELVQYDEDELVYTNSNVNRTSLSLFDRDRSVYIVYRGRVDMIKQIESPTTRSPPPSRRPLTAASNRTTNTSRCQSGARSRQTSERAKSNLYRVCELNKYDYFGFENQSDVNTWFVAREDNTCVLRISHEEFMAVHEHARWLLAHMAQDYESAIPSIEQLRKRVDRLATREKYLDRFVNNLKY